MRRGLSPPPASPLFPQPLALPWRPRKPAAPYSTPADMPGPLCSPTSFQRLPPLPIPAVVVSLATWVRNLSLPLNYCVVLGMLVNISVLQLSHLQSGDSNCTDLIALSWGLNESSIQYLEQGWYTVSLQEV